MTAIAFGYKIQRIVGGRITNCRDSLPTRHCNGRRWQTLYLVGVVRVLCIVEMLSSEISVVVIAEAINNGGIGLKLHSFY